MIFGDVAKRQLPYKGQSFCATDCVINQGPLVMRLREQMQHPLDAEAPSLGWVV